MTRCLRIADTGSTGDRHVYSRKARLCRQTALEGNSVVITRSIVQGISVKIYNADALSMTLRAESAHLDKRRHKPRFLHASLEDARSDRHISSKEIIWDARDKAFLIPGDYLAQTASGHRQGQRGKD